MLVNTTINSLAFINMGRPFAIHLDAIASDHAAGGILAQTIEGRSEKPVAFASVKFKTFPLKKKLVYY